MSNIFHDGDGFQKQLEELSRRKDEFERRQEILRNEKKRIEKEINGLEDPAGEIITDWPL